MTVENKQFVISPNFSENEKAFKSSDLKASKLGGDPARTRVAGGKLADIKGVARKMRSIFMRKPCLR